MLHNTVFMTLYLETVRNQMNIRELSEASGIGYTSLRRKMRGDCPFLLWECQAIKAVLHSELPIEKLFERVKENA